MLKAPTNDRKTKAKARGKTAEPFAEQESQAHLPSLMGRFSGREGLSTCQPNPLQQRSSLPALQKTYGNQAVLRMSRGEQGRSPIANPIQGALQRKCACGNSAGSSGSCAECQSKQEGVLQTKLQISEPGDRYEQEADRIAAQIMKIPSTTPLPIGKKDNVTDIKRMSSFSSSKQLPPGEEEVGEDYLDSFFPDEYILEPTKDDFFLQTFQDITIRPDSGVPIRAGSGTCFNGAGSSTCNINNGLYEITANENTCCTTSCTQQHEMQHVIDHTSWGCCKKFSQELKSNANRSGVIRAYEKWFEIVRPITECHAYTKDVKCITEMEKAKDCKGKGAKSECCADIADYKTRYSSLKQKFCSEAPSKVPPCPKVFI